MHKIAKTPVNAASLSRVWQHTQGTNLGIITAFRGPDTPEMEGIDNTLQENRGRNSELSAAIRAAGFGYLKVKGRYIENYGTPKAQPVDEESFFVIGNKGDDSGNLYGFLKKQGEKFAQDSILFKPYNDDDAYLYGTSHNPDSFPGYGQKHNVGKWHPNRISEFQTLLFPDKTFSFAGAKITAKEYEKIGFYNQRTFSSRGPEREF